MLVWLSAWSEVQIVCMWSSWCHCIPNPHHLLSRLNPDWFYQVVVEKRPLNGCSSSSSSSSSSKEAFRRTSNVRNLLHLVTVKQGVTVGRPLVRSSVRSIDCSNSSRRVCCWAPCVQKISIDSCARRAACAGAQQQSRGVASRWEETGRRLVTRSCLGDRVSHLEYNLSAFAE